MKKRSGWKLLNLLNKKGDIWVSAVLYFGLGIVLLTLVLSLGMPVINRLRDKNVATQTKDVFATLDANIREVARGGPATQRILQLGLSKGEVKVYSASNAEKSADSNVGTDAKDIIFPKDKDPDGDPIGPNKDIPNRVVWTYQLKAALSEPGMLVTEGNTKLLTLGGKGNYNVRFWLDYEPLIYLRLEGANIISGNTKIMMKNMGSGCINKNTDSDPDPDKQDYSPSSGGLCTQDPSIQITGPTGPLNVYPGPRVTIQIQPVQ